MSTVKVPATIAEAQTELGSLGALLTATEWHRAAIVATFVKEHAAGRPPRNRTESSDYESPAAFAARGIVGLSSHTTVRLYMTRWLDANEGKHPKPGSRVRLPNAEWGDTRTGTNGANTEEGARRTLDRMVEKHGADTVARIVAEAAPEAVAEAVVAQAPEAAGRAVAKNKTARKASNAAQAEGLPEAPFDHLPRVHPSSDAMELAMEARRIESALHGAIIRVEMFHRDTPGLLDLDRLHREQDVLATVVMAVAEHHAEVQR